MRRSLKPDNVERYHAGVPKIGCVAEWPMAIVLKTIGPERGP